MTERNIGQEILAGIREIKAHRAGKCELRTHTLSEPSPLRAIREKLGLSIERQGIQQGEVTILHLQLQRRFGPLPDWVTQRLTQAQPAQLETWAERLLDARTLESVFEENRAPASRNRAVPATTIPIAVATPGRCPCRPS